MEPIFLNHLALWHRRPTGTPRGRVLLVHGIGEHSGRHIHTIDFLTGEGFEVVHFDLRGAGRSGGRRQWIGDFWEYVDDTTEAHLWIQRTLPAQPLFLLGHSLGGAVATHFASVRGDSLTGLILSAPAYLTGSAISPLTVAVGRVVSKFLPMARVPANTDYAALSRDPQVGIAYRADPLSCHFNTLEQGRAILDALQTMPERVSRIRCPVFFVHGTMDRIIRCEGTFELLQACPSRTKEVMLIPGGYHEPHNDLDRDDYFARLRSWLLKRLS